MNAAVSFWCSSGSLPAESRNQRTPYRLPGTTECIITDIPEEKSPSPAMPGGMGGGGMDGMM